MKKHVIILLMLLSAQAFGQTPEGPTFDIEEYEMGQRATREYLERLRESGITPSDIYQQWQQSRAWISRKGADVQGTTNWEFLGPKNQGGRIKGLGVGSQDTLIWFCAADGGGIWKSTTAGASWTPLTDTLPSLRMSTLAMSPFDDDLVIGVTHEGFIYRTTDGGDSWQVIIEKGVGYGYELQFHPKDPEKVLLATDGGIFRSTNAGATWSLLRSGGRVVSISFNQNKPSTFFYSENNLRDSGFIWRTTDGGENWSAVKTGRASYWSRVNVRVAPSDPKIVYCSYPDTAAYYQSTDGGTTWKPLPMQPVRDGYHRGFDHFAVSPASPDILIAGSTSIYRTTDGGASWSGGDTVNKDLHVDQHFFLFPPQLDGTFICGNDGGIYRTSGYIDEKLQWTRRDSTLATLQIYNIAQHPFTIDTIIVGCQDNGYDKFTNNENKWKVVGGDGFCTIYDYQNPAYFYHEYVHQNLHRADDGFTWWSKKVMTGLPTGKEFYDGIDSNRADWFGQGVVMSPVDPKVLYMGTNQLYRTRDRAEHWELVSSKDYAFDRNDVTTGIAVARTTPAQIYLGTNRGKIYRVIDDAAPQSIDITPSFGAIGRIRGFAISPTDPLVAYVGGDGGWQNKGVMKTTNGGTSWVVKSNGLPRSTVNRIIQDVDSANTLYAATIYGLYFSRDGGDQWNIMPGLPNAEIWDVVMDKKTRTLLLGTYGRGAIRAKRFTPPEAPPAPLGVPESDAITSSAISLNIVSGPNPSVQITSGRRQQLTVSLYDVLGREVVSIYSGYAESGLMHLSLPNSESLGSGTFMVVARSAGALVQKMFSIAR